MKKFVTKIYLILTLDCESSAKLASDSFDRDLDWSENVAAKLHRMICSKSRRLHRQLSDLNRAIHIKVDGQNEPGKSHSLPVIDMPKKAKERIRDHVKDMQGPE